MLSRVRYWLPAALTAVVVVVASAAAARAEQALAWKFKVGDKAQYVLVQESNILIDANGVEFDVEMNQTLDLTWTVKSVADDGTAELVQTVDRVIMKMATPFTGEFSYDSASGQDGEGQVWEMMGPLIKGMVGAEFTMKVTPAGEVTDIELPQGLGRALRGGGRGGRGGGFSAMMMGGGFSEESIKEIIQRSFVLLPSGAAADGAQWSQTFVANMGPLGKQTTAIQYTLEGCDEATGLVRIGSTTELSMEAPENADFDIVMELTEQDGKGFVLFDAEAGRAVESRHEQSLVIEGEFQGNEIIQERESRTTVKLGTSADLASSAALAWKFNAGDSTQYAMVQASEIIIDAGGVQFDVEMRQIMDLTWTVKSVAEDGSAQLVQTIDRVQLKMNTPFTGEFYYDSASGQDGAGQVWDMIGGVFKSMLGAEFTMTVSPRGEVTDIVLPKALVDALSGDGGGGGMRSMLMGGGFSEDSIKELIGRAVVLLPEAGAAAGTEWTQTFEANLGGIGTQTTELTYKLEGPDEESGMQKITSSANLKMELSEDGAADVVLEIVEQDGSTTILFDAVAGRAVRAEGKQKVVLEGEFQGNEIFQERELLSLVLQGSSDDLPDDWKISKPPAAVESAE